MTKLISRETSEYVIVIGQNASEPVRYAASELSKYLSRMTGVVLPIVSENFSAGEKEICVGTVDRADMPETKDLINDGWRLATVGDRLFVAGGNDRGVLFGVYGLLEEAFGVRFFAPDAENVPIRCELDLPQMNLTRISPFEYRSCFWYVATTDPDFAAKQGLNGMHNELQPRHGGSVNYYPFVHSFNHLVPLETYGAEHPEYYSMINGVRKVDSPHATQLCLTNPDVLKIAIKQVREDIEEHPEATIFSVSQNDCYFPCECPECSAIDKAEGTYCGTVLRFVNAIANDIAKDYPHVIIDTLAYHHTRQCPKITRPAPNVTVRLCTIEGCFSHPMEECEVATCAYYINNNKAGNSMVKDFEDWSKICDRLSLWDYQTNFTYYLNPFPNVPVLQKNIQYFLRHHVTSLFEQGNAQSPSGEWGELKSYLSAKLMWQPDGDVDLWTREFLEGYYGRAAAPLAEFLNMFHDYVKKADIHTGIRVPTNWGHMPEEVLSKAEELFDRAERMAEDEQVLERVQRSRLSIRFVRVNNYDRNAPEFPELAEAFRKDLKRLGITHIQESRDFDWSFERILNGEFYEDNSWWEPYNPKNRK